MQTDKTTLSASLFQVWPLLLGLGVIGISVGVQGTLIGIRANIEGFETWLTGLIISGYFGGFIFGALHATAIIQRVGHVRTFGACTALASTAVLFHPIVIEPVFWVLLQVLSGLAFSSMYVVADSWLNHAATDATRGRILSLYSIMLFGGIGAGQLVFTVINPASYQAFTLISAMVSLAAIPILMTSTPTPPLGITDRVSLRKLFEWAPFWRLCR